MLEDVAERILLLRYTGVTIVEQRHHVNYVARRSIEIVLQMTLIELCQWVISKEACETGGNGTNSRSSQ